MDANIDVSGALIRHDFVEKIVRNREYNETIIKYYMRLFKETKNVKYQNIAFNIDYCNKLWLFDFYKQSKVKSFLKTSLCHNKFCTNCKKIKQAQRIKKFLPVMQKFDDDLYFLTLTVPNVNGGELRQTINNMQKAYSKLIGYLNGTKHIRGIDFSNFGYLGSLRSLEVTFKSKDFKGGFDRRFHPHFHAAVVLSNFKESRKNIRNRFSDDYTGKRGLALFSKECVLLQKLWRLLVEGKKVTKDSLDQLRFGYSVTLDKFERGRYQQMFKYMIKDFPDDKIGKDKRINYMDYDTFKILLFELDNINQLVGTGVFRGIKDVKDVEFLNEVDKYYMKFIEYLNKKESPIKIMETPQSVLSSGLCDYIYVSKNKIYSYLKQIVLEEFQNQNENTVNNSETLTSDIIQYFDDLCNLLCEQKTQLAKKIQFEIAHSN